MRTATPIALAIALVVAGCGQDPAAPEPQTVPEPATPAATPGTPPAAAPVAGEIGPPVPQANASVALEPTEGNETAGTLTLTARADGVGVIGTLTGLTPDAEHGFHIHQFGDCSAPDATSAGDHFNPQGVQHGHPEGDGESHGGDLLNAVADADGNARVDVLATGVSLGTGDPDDVIGKAVIVHEQPDDYETQPTGDAGGRLACGVIEPATAAATPPTE